MDFPMNMFRDQLSKIASPRIPVQTQLLPRRQKPGRLKGGGAVAHPEQATGH